MEKLKQSLNGFGVFKESELKLAADEKVWKQAVDLLARYVPHSSSFIVSEFL